MPKYKDFVIVGDTICGYNYDGDKNVVVPKTVNGTVIKRINSLAFYGMGLKSIKLPNTIREIKESVFMNNKLKQITLPKSLETMGVKAFANNEIENIHFNNKLTHIKKRSFSNNQVDIVNLPKNIKKIDDLAFNENKLKKIVFQRKRPVDIGKWAFYYQKNIALEGLERIKENLFGVWVRKLIDGPEYKGYWVPSNQNNSQ